MPLITKNKKPQTKKGAAIVDGSVGNYEKHPFFIKKAAEAKDIIKEIGVPKKGK